MTERTESFSEARILIADGVELFRRGIRDVLHRDRRLVVVGEISTVADLPKACMKLAPHVVFLGFESERWDGAPERTNLASLDALHQAIELEPFVHVIVLLEHESSGDVMAAVRAGASGALLRDAPASLLLDAARDVLAGGAALDPRLARSLFEHLAGAEPSNIIGFPRAPLSAGTLRLLSQREQEVLCALAQGLRNKEIAAELGVSVGTVKTHLRHIFRKLHVADRTAAVLTALQVRLPEAA